MRKMVTIAIIKYSHLMAYDTATFTTKSKVIFDNSRHIECIIV